MAEYLTNFRFTFATEAAMLACLEWIKDNYAAKVASAQALSTLAMRIDLVDITFDDAVTSITAVRNQYTDELDEWTLNMQ